MKGTLPYDDVLARIKKTGKEVCDNPFYSQTTAYMVHRSGQVPQSSELSRAGCSRNLINSYWRMYRIEIKGILSVLAIVGSRRPTNFFLRYA